MYTRITELLLQFGPIVSSFSILMYIAKRDANSPPSLSFEDSLHCHGSDLFFVLSYFQLGIEGKGAYERERERRKVRACIACIFLILDLVRCDFSMSKQTNTLSLYIDLSISAYETI